MKFNLDNLFETLDASELDEIMPNGFDAELPKGSLKRIEKAVLRRAGYSKSRRPNLRILAPAAACIAVAAGLGSVAIAAENKEYNAAVDFFAQNGLSAEGLSRGEVKAVYRDITTNRFTNEKTADVIARSVSGVEILQDEPTPEELATFWNSNMQNALPSGDIEYTVDYVDKQHPTLGFDIIDKSVLECRRGGKTLWTAEFPELYVSNNDCVSTSSGTAVWGHTDTWSSEMPVSAYIACIDDNGSKLWERLLDNKAHGFTREYIMAVLENDDGTWTVISDGDYEYMCVSRFDMSGNELGFQKTVIGNNGIRNTARLGDGYLVQIGNTMEGRTAHIVKLDSEGNVTDNFVYESEDCDYYITDMTEFEGNVYLSAYAVPKQTDEGGRHELSNILDYVFSRENWEISSEELTPIVRDNYTAVLLLCDPEGGEPRNFYSVKGALGGALTVENGTLKWNAESIISTLFSPYTSSYTIGGSCKVIRCTFDSSGALISNEETGETTRFSR